LTPIWASDGTDIDDRSVGGLDEGEGGFRDDVSPFHVDAVEALEILERGFLDAADQADPSAVDQDVEFFDFRDGCLDGLFVGHVADNHAGAGEFFGKRIGPRLIDAEDQDGGSSTGEGAGSSFTNAARPAGDERDAVVEPKRSFHSTYCSVFALKNMGSRSSTGFPQHASKGRDDAEILADLN
jgi:hypothetical protein